MTSICGLALEHRCIRTDLGRRTGYLDGGLCGLHEFLRMYSLIVYLRGHDHCLPIPFQFDSCTNHIVTRYLRSQPIQRHVAR
jgi:hypothetical protein